MALLFRRSHCTVVLRSGSQEFSKQSPGDLTSAFFNCITSVRATQSSDNAGEIEIVCEATLQDGIKILKSRLLGTGYRGASFTPTTPVAQEELRNTIEKSQELLMEVTFEYPGETLSDNSTPARSVTYIAQSQSPKVSINNQNVTITLTGFGTIWNLKGIEVAKKFNGSPIDIISDLARAVNTEIVFKDEALDVLESADPIDATFSGSPLEIVKKILLKQKTKLYIYDGYSEEGRPVITVTSENVEKGSKAKYFLVLLRDINTARNILPIWDFRAESSVLFLPNQPFGFYSSAVDTNKKEVTKPEENTFNRDKNLIPQQSAEGTTIRVPGFVNKQNDSRQQLNNMAGGTENSLEAFDITCPGIPDLFPRDKVNVKIADGIPAYDGDFIVISLTHNWSDSVWVSELRVGFPKALGREEAPASTKVDNSSSSKNVKQSVGL